MHGVELARPHELVDHSLRHAQKLGHLLGHHKALRPFGAFDRGGHAGGGVARIISEFHDESFLNQMIDSAADPGADGASEAYERGKTKAVSSRR